MSITPPQSTSSIAVSRAPKPVVRRPVQRGISTNSEHAPIIIASRSGPATSTAYDSTESLDAQMTAAQTSLTSLISQLSRQLAGIERTFIKALQSLVRNFVTQGNPAAPARLPGSQSAQTVNPYDGLIRRTAQRHDLDPALLTAVVRAESNFDPRAVSKAGALGLMQLMPSTAKSLGVTDPFNPQQSVEGGASLLRGYIDRYGGRLDLALAAYNAGPGAVEKYGGVPPYAETRNYVSTILADYRASALNA